jgi:hypothetical protein
MTDDFYLELVVIIGVVASLMSVSMFKDDLNDITVTRLGVADFLHQLSHVDMHYLFHYFTVTITD